MNTQDDNPTEFHDLLFALSPSVTTGHATTVIPQKKIKKTERDAAVAKQTVAVAFHKESQKLAKKGVVVPKLADMNQQALLAVTRKDLDDDWCNWSAIGKFFLMFMIADVIG